jgi:hypothetical protein
VQELKLQRLEYVGNFSDRITISQVRLGCRLAAAGIKCCKGKCGILGSNGSSLLISNLHPYISNNGVMDHTCKQGLGMLTLERSEVWWSEHTPATEETAASKLGRGVFLPPVVHILQSGPRCIKGKKDKRQR